MARILCPVTVGREQEQVLLGTALDSALAGQGRVLFLSGPAGIGKSRLAAEVAGWARDRRARAVSGRCVTSLVPVPYRPLAEALIGAPEPDAAIGSAELAGFGPALGAIVPAWRSKASSSTMESPLVVAEALRRALRAIAGSVGCVLLVEDLQWADPETLHALEYLADHGADSPILCLCTLRDETPSDAWHLFLRLDSRRACEGIRLGPLEPGQVQEMGRRALGTAELDPALAEMLQRGAEGIPLLVEELLAAAAMSGSPSPQGTTGAVSAPIPVLVPPSFGATVQARVETLSVRGQRLVAAGALLGRSFDWELAREAASCSSAQARALLEQAVSLQLLMGQDAGFSFRHALTREAILDRLLPSERAQLAGRCLQALQAHPPPGPDWQHLAADLAEGAGQPDRGAAFLLTAGRGALGRAALHTARAALERAARVAVDPALRAEVLAALAESSSAAGDLAATEAATSSLLEQLAAIGGDPGQRGHAHLLLARCAVTAGHFDLAGQELARARQLAQGPEAGPLAARVGSVAAQLAIGEGRMVEAEALAVRAATDAGATSQPEVVCEALEVAARCARTRDLGEAREIGERALQVAEAAGLGLWQLRAHYQLGVVEMFATGGVSQLERARDEAQRLGAVATAASLDVEIAAGLEFQHRASEARRRCAQALESARVLDLPALEAVAHAFLAIIAASAGNRAEMEAAIDPCFRLARGDREIEAAVWGDARAIASLSDEDRPRARSELEQAVALYGRGSGAVPRLATALLPVLQALDREKPNFELAQGVTALHSQPGGYLAYARAIHAGGAGERALAEEWARRGDLRLGPGPWYQHLIRRLAAEAALADGWGNPVAWLGEALDFFAGDGAKALAAACRGLLRQAGVRVARPTKAAQALPHGLRQAGVTPREAEVLALLGLGLSNRELGRRLFLSERTVEQHVGLLKQKLGLRNRAQLAVHAAAQASAADQEPHGEVRIRDSPDAPRRGLPPA
ncbi:MAG: ATP-binding protein [Candidatus Dormibacteria bacterium]